MRLRLASDAEPGRRALRALTPLGPSEAGWFFVNPWPEIARKKPNNTREQAQTVALPATVNGALDPAEDMDWYRFHGEKGRTLVFDLLAERIGSPLDATLSIQDSRGRELAFNDDFHGADPFLTFIVPETADYYVLVRDLRFQGGPAYTYRLTMGEIPYVTAAFPSAGMPGGTLELELTGYNLGAQRSRVTLPADGPFGSIEKALTLPNGASNPIRFFVEENPGAATVRPAPDMKQAPPLPIPSSVHARLGDGSPTATGDYYRFRAEKDQKLTIEVTARRLGSRLDSVLAVLDMAGKELASNDDSVGLDSRLEFSAPQAGDYLVRVTDLHGRRGAEFPYLLTLAAPPDFRLTAPARVAIPAGGAVPFTVTATRLHGFSDDIALEVENLPAAVLVRGKPRIPAGRNDTTLVLMAPAGSAGQSVRYRLRGTATIGGKTVRRIALGLEEIVRNEKKAEEPVTLSVAAVVPAPDIVVTTSVDRVTLAPGGTAEISVKIARADGFTAKMPIAVLGLPPNVTATPTEIPEKQSELKVQLKADPKAVPGEAEIVVVGGVVLDAQRQAPNAAVPVILTIKKP